MTLKIVICSENAVLCDLLTDYLQGLGDMLVLGSGAEASDLAVYCDQASVLLLDAAAREAARQLRQMLANHDHLRAVVIGVDDTSGSIVDFARAGAASILPRDSGLEEVTSAIGKVQCNGVHCPARIGARLMRGLARSGAAARRGSLDRLTPREREVAQCLQQGFSNKEIARTLSIEIATTKNHIHNLLSKIGVDSRAKAVAVLLHRPGGDTLWPPGAGGAEELL